MPIRPARPSDAEAIAAILDREIREGVAHFGDRAPRPAQLRAEIGQHATHPFLVLAQPEVVGFAAVRPWKQRAAYRWAAEVGIYLHPAAQGAGHGGQLLDGLIAAAREAGLRTLVAGMTLPNPASQGLFVSRGFTAAGRFECIGYKHGQWHDVGYWTLDLQSPA